jgi:hypothetical protein
MSDQLPNNSIAASQFYKAWLQVVNEMKSQLVSDWRNPKRFTNLIKSSEGCVVEQISNKLNKRCYADDYYSIDAVLYCDEDRVSGMPEGSIWLTGMSVAFEHENDIRGIYREISHLLLMNADLRVLVTYPNDDIDGPEWQRAHSVIKTSRGQKEVSDRESFLVIIGWETGFQWEGYVYKEDAWKPVSLVDM